MYTVYTDGELYAITRKVWFRKQEWVDFSFTHHLNWVQAEGLNSCYWTTRDNVIRTLKRLNPQPVEIKDVLCKEEKGRSFREDKKCSCRESYSVYSHIHCSNLPGIRNI